MDQVDPFEAIRIEFRVQEPRPKRRPKPKPAPRPIPDPQQGPREPHPWETEDFDPGDRERQRLLRTEGRSLMTGFRTGSALVEWRGRPWVVIQNPRIWPTAPSLLSYPLPDGIPFSDPFEALIALGRPMAEELDNLLSP